MTTDWLQLADRIAVHSWQIFVQVFQKHYLEDEGYNTRRDRLLLALAQLETLCPPGATDATVDWEAVDAVLAKAEVFARDFALYAERVNQEALAELPKVWRP